MKNLETRYLERLSDLYPTIAAASTEIINLQAILNLPKGTEHFLTDIHGEYEAFSHVLKNGSGSVRRKIDDVFGNTLSSRDKQSLATLIYYPKDKMAQVKKVESNMEDWYKINLYRLIEVSKRAASKYTRSKVRKALPKDFAYVIEELITEKGELSDKESYYNEIIMTIIRIGRAEEFIVAISELIQRLVVDHLHIVGDIYDRGPGPHIIMDKLMSYHSIDIQWGNHDVLWMGAATGQRGCIANVIRICARYGNLDILEDGYGINLLPLATFAIRTYGDDPCTCFTLKGQEKANKAEMEMDLRMHKAISILQFKVEGQIIKRQKDFHLDDRALLHRIDYEKGTITLNGKEYQLLDTNFPTIDPKDPYKLSAEEEEVMERLERAFLGCEKLQEHMRFLLAKGGLYKVYNNNLLYHGCVPLNDDGSLKEVELFGRKFKGRTLYDALDRYLRKGFFALDEEDRDNGRDMMWYIWLHPNSPLFGKDKMATFERYFLAEKETHIEKKNPYYFLLEKEEVVDNIMKEFGLDPDGGHIVNGHVPVKRKNGESPIKCDGKVLVIDGGFSKAYQQETGIAGYTLIYNSYGLLLVAHEPFESTEAAIQKESDIHSEYMVVKRVMERRLVGDTDIGKDLKEQVEDLERLLAAYRSGEIIEKI
ncbi:fructose-1,6-bisphosphatase [Clostridium sp. AF19-22AC]|jgi:fructose-1,6-bisphosphatase-3|uniref:Fructose-1,6-bisphosphatase class 3 n=1 Tax=Faecalicatena orotica TaxID=1544 RepID=A0A2Y9BB64_9FIRM|nr:MULTISPECIES: fructose-1,6-bisphosphatase [Clostridia]PWJ32164.1 fructose-1,6-bisphosphatase-3 [Faecalicatena orotica]RHR32011.1 fructose-1,6-bisphosphatase [Clostridium sp. AF19-22AC]SSA53997.1 fructose-1,6-bisphosphatase-3 [Faecalicatena orotica]